MSNCENPMNIPLWLENYGIFMGFSWGIIYNCAKKIPEGKSSTRPSLWWKVNWEDFKLGDFLWHGQGQTPSLLEWFSALFSSVSEILGMVYGRSFFKFSIFDHFSSFSYWKMVYFMGILGSHHFLRHFSDIGRIGPFSAQNCGKSRGSVRVMPLGDDRWEIFEVYHLVMIQSRFRNYDNTTMIIMG